MPFLRLSFLSLSAALVLWSCGGSEPAQPEAASAPPPAKTSPAPTETPKAQEPPAQSAGAEEPGSFVGRQFPRPAQELSFTSVDGRQVSLADLKGKTVNIGNVNVHDLRFYWTTTNNTGQLYYE